MRLNGRDPATECVYRALKLYGPSTALELEQRVRLNDECRHPDNRRLLIRAALNELRRLGYVVRASRINRGAGTRWKAR